MTEQKWEFCRLWVKIQRSEDGKLYGSLTIDYIGEGENIQAPSITKENNSKGWDYDPSVKAMAMLGIYGWELVSVQHANYNLNIGGKFSAAWLLVNSVAYFKRPVQKGRRVDEPNLTLE